MTIVLTLHYSIHSTRAVSRVQDAVSLLVYDRISPEVLYVSDPTMSSNYGYLGQPCFACELPDLETPQQMFIHQ